MKKVGLDKRLNHFPSELSGGESQRVAISRALINSPDIILADEPTGNLDVKNAKDIFKLLFSLRNKNRIIILSAIDNLIKGGAGQAIQNMNIKYGFPINAGLK